MIIKTLRCPYCGDKTGGSAFRLVYDPNREEDNFYLQCIDCGDEYPLELIKKVLVNIQED